MGRGRVRRGGLGILLAIFATLVLAAPALAWEAEGGTKSCGNFITYLHAHYNDQGYLTPPGSAYEYDYYYYDGLWHTTEVNGSYSGSWYAIGDPRLDLPGTWVACRAYG